MDVFAESKSLIRDAMASPGRFRFLYQQKILEELGKTVKPSSIPRTVTTLTPVTFSLWSDHVHLFQSSGR